MEGGVVPVGRERNDGCVLALRWATAAWSVAVGWMNSLVMPRLGRDCDSLRATRWNGLLAIRLARPKANALNSEVLADLREAVGTAAADSSVRGAVLASAVPGIFSAGFDAREIFPYGAAEIKTFFGAFTEVCHAMLDL